MREWCLQEGGHPECWDATGEVAERAFPRSDVSAEP